MICDYCKKEIEPCLSNVTIKNFNETYHYCNTICMRSGVDSEFVQVRKEDLIAILEVHKELINRCIGLDRNNTNILTLEFYQIMKDKYLGKED